ncbi:pyridoxamine 5'-phosphate oxidase family protein [Pedobacter changchengzhani]|uniref:Pyridoxamine 5'-phosphate oxidase family protein n=1 Tax=Pedobacter changchengzhani TaxID=2529274 RepID=A0A4R5MNZ6_9SPHI|nr:pyridoxamine 5'-phosphate oxidase family protein [Pedobacter changchengzhani]TDG37560.1 pyridoxamine 5'-phosphate oxidase family protein [Pedobacter changchengzhani]
MLGDLSKREIIDLLTKQVIGRIGCSADGETYIVPINYVYKDNAIYGHSALGKKIEMMRANPTVCFQVDEITDTFRWKSVIISGKYSELSEEVRQQAMQGIIHRIMPLTDKPTEDPSHGIKPEERDHIIVFKIELTDVSGKFEDHD